jgi:hypothetical protein
MGLFLNRQSGETHAELTMFLRPFETFALKEDWLDLAAEKWGV